MSRWLLGVLFLVSATLSHAQGSPQSDAQPGSNTESRRTPERPTALPENRDLADQFTRYAAAYTTQVQIVKMMKQDVGRLSMIANWLYFNAIDLSDEKYAQSQFRMHFRAYAKTSETLAGDLASSDADVRKRAFNTLVAKMNSDLEAGESLYKKYEHVFNKVIERPDGSFEIIAR